MADTVKDLFSEHADLYARFRPLYPQALFDFILDQVPLREAALDCGTGNGQAAAILADYFKVVHAMDISETQISKAVKKTNLYYHVGQSEKTNFTENSFDLITCATSVHWFSLEEFFSEMKRIGKNGSIVACWGFKIFVTDEPVINDLVNEFYYQTIYPYWDPERKHVDAAYATIPFPFSEINNPGFETTLDWDLSDLEGYLNTWSGVQKFINKNKWNPVNMLMENIKTKIPGTVHLKMTFPIFMRMGIIRK